MKNLAARVALASALGSVISVGLLLYAHFAWKSELALAQAADSMMDVAAAVLLSFTAKVGEAPRDERHPFGHSRAEPLGALGIAILAAALAVEVERSAFDTLLGKSDLRAEFPLLIVFALKVTFKSVVFLVARGRSGAVLEALAADAKNDVLLGGVAVVGFAFARIGTNLVDAWLSVPVGLYIGYNGVSLARENIDRLMGVAPTPERLQVLSEIARAEAPPEAEVRLLSHHLGTQLGVEVDLTLPAEFPFAELFSVSERIRTALEAEEDVIHAVVRPIPRENRSR